MSVMEHFQQIAAVTLLILAFKESLCALPRQQHVLEHNEESRHLLHQVLPSCHPWIEYRPCPLLLSSKKARCKTTMFWDNCPPPSVEHSLLDNGVFVFAGRVANEEPFRSSCGSSCGHSFL